MVIYDFDFLGIGSAPDEADAPLFVDADAMLALSVSFERLEAIARRELKEFKLHGRVDELKLCQRALLNVGRQPF